MERRREDEKKLEDAMKMLSRFLKVCVSISVKIPKKQSILGCVSGLERKVCASTCVKIMEGGGPSTEVPSNTGNQKL